MILRNFSLIVYAIWLLSEILLNRLKRSAEADKKNEDKSSLAVIWITIAVSITAASFVSGYFSFPFGDYQFIHPAGLALIIIGILFRFAAVRTLGKMFTVDVTIREGHELQTAGMYKLLRHPSYTGSLISFIGMGLAMNNIISFIIVALPVLFSFIYRAGIEEKLLQQTFGEQYKEYMKRSWRFFPWIY